MKRLCNMIFLLLVRYKHVILILSAYALVSFFTIYKVILNNHAYVGMRHDWYSAPYSQMIIDHIKSVLYIWNYYFGYQFLRSNVLYYRLFDGILGLFTGFSGLVLFKVEIAILIFMSGVFLYYMIRVIGASKLSAFIAGLFYMITPVIFDKTIAGHLGYVFSYAFAPLVFALFLKGVGIKERNSTRFRYIVLAGLVYGMSVAQHQFFMYIIILIVVYILIASITKYRSFISGIKVLGLTTLVTLIGLLMHLFWILPDLVYGAIPIYHLSPLDYHGIVASPDALESLLMIGYPHPYDYKFLIVRGVLPQGYVVLLAFPLISVVTLLDRSNKFLYRYKVFALVLLFLGIFLTAATKSPLGFLWRFLYIHYSIFRIFRETYNSEFLVAFSISLLYGLFINDILNKLKRFKEFNKPLTAIFITLCIILTLIVGLPVISGNFLGQLGTYTFPYAEYKSIYQKIHSDNRTYRVLFLPSIGPFKYFGKSFYSKFQGLDPMLQSPPKPSFLFIVDRTKPLSRFQEYFIYRIRQNENIKNYLYITSTRYIIIRPFCKSLYLYYVPSSVKSEILWKNFNFLNYFRHNSLISNSVKKGNIILIFLNNTLRYIRITEPYYVIGDLGTIGKLPEEAIKNSSLIYCTPHTSAFINISKLIIINSPDWLKELVTTLLLSKLEARELILKTEYINPNIGWSYDTLSWWKNQKIASLTFYYGTNTILTSAKGAQIKKFFNINRSNYYFICIKYLKSIKGGVLRVLIDNNVALIKTKDKIDSFHWICIGPYYLRKGYHSITLTNKNGFNAVSAIVLVPRENYYKALGEIENLLKKKTIIYIFNVATSFYRKNSNVIKYNNTKVMLFGEQGDTWQYINILKSGNYRIALKGVGTFKVKIGNYTFILNSTTLSNFTYSPLFHLNKGEYRIDISSLSIKNIVKNPSFEETLNKMPIGWQLCNNRHFKIYLDKGYYGKYSLKVVTNTTKRSWSWIVSNPIKVQPGKTYLVITHMKIYNTNASHIVIEGYFLNKNKWKQITQVPPGVDGTGTYGWKTFSTSITIPKYVTKIRVVLNAGWVLDKKKGPAVTWFDYIRIVPIDNATKLNAVWIYSSYTGNNTVPRLFTIRKHTKILFYKKINPITWKVKVLAKEPFMLTFAEGYSPFWEAKVFKNDTLIKIVKSIPVFDSINGFWINASGHLTIIIYYIPQSLFELGLKITIATIVICIIYILLDLYKFKKVLKGKG